MNAMTVQSLHKGFCGCGWAKAQVGGRHADFFICGGWHVPVNRCPRELRLSERAGGQSDLGFCSGWRVLARVSVTVQALLRITTGQPKSRAGREETQADEGDGHVLHLPGCDAGT